MKQVHGGSSFFCLAIPDFVEASAGLDFVDLDAALLARVAHRALQPIDMHDIVRRNAIGLRDFAVLENRDWQRDGSAKGFSRGEPLGVKFDLSSKEDEGWVGYGAEVKYQQPFFAVNVHVPATFWRPRACWLELIDINVDVEWIAERELDGQRAVMDGGGQL